ncbi:MAG: PIN domain-containing protein [Spirochaetes bacterium]|nr:PIN domain-containing protein [Spirochaetota bacterium]
MPSQILVDANVILDIFLDDPRWADWSESILNSFGTTHRLCINPVIYSEVSIGFSRIEDLENAIQSAGFFMREPPREALFLAGKVFLKYRRMKGVKTSTLPDFFIGAHAAVCGMDIITRDTSRYATYFPTVGLVTPKNR